MAELEIQKFLRGDGSLGDLNKDPYELQIKVHPDRKRVGFKYNQIKSDMKLPICQEARGLVLDMTDNWNVVSFPFKKFFNSGESQAHEIDWETAEVVEKLDGSCSVLYHWNGEWKMQTLGTIEGEGEVHNDGILSLDFEGETFSNLFFHAWDTVYGRALLDELDTDLNYIFELITPFNRIVTRYEGYRLPLIGVRNRKTFQEYDPRDFAETFDIPRYFDFKSLDLDQVMASLDFLRDDEEGYVIVDGDFNRIKVKSPTYVMYHRQKDHAVNRKHGTLKLILLGKEDDFVSSFPEFKDEIEDVKRGIQTFVKMLDNVYVECGGPECLPDKHESRKSFALKVNDVVPPAARGVMFARMSGKVEAFDEALIEMAEQDKLGRVVQAMNEFGVLNGME